MGAIHCLVLRHSFLMNDQTVNAHSHKLLISLFLCPSLISCICICIGLGQEKVRNGSL